YSCSTQILSTAPLGTYSMTGSVNGISDSSGAVISSDVSVQGVITVNSTGGCAIAWPGDQRGVAWILLSPRVALVFARGDRKTAKLVVVLSAVVGMLLVGKVLGQEGAADVEGDLTVTQPVPEESSMSEQGTASGVPVQRGAGSVSGRW